MKITENTKLKDLRNIPEIGKNYIYVSYSTGLFRPIFNSMTVKKLAPAGGPADMLKGLHRLAEVAKQGEYLYPLYPADRKDKKDVNLIRFPAESGKKKPFVIVCAGGGYGSVASLGEAFPTAARLNELGYHAFCLTYQVGGKKLLPKPLDDLATALKFLMENKEKFDLSDEYIVCGFSAGGNLTALWGTDNVGYSHYGLPKPKAVFPIYPLINYSWRDNMVIGICLDIMFGKKPSQEELHRYTVTEHVENYPPCYTVNCLDDSTVRPENAKLLKDALDKANIPCVLEQGEKGEHGFGPGTGTSVEGWVDRAIAFAEAL